MTGGDGVSFYSKLSDENVSFDHYFGSPRARALFLNPANGEATTRAAALHALPRS